MLLSILSQFSAKYLLVIFLYLVVAYVLVKMLQQKSLILFLGYKVLLIIYVGWCLSSNNLDILGLILWIVYGSFLVVFFLFAFLWIDTKQPLQLYNATPQQQTALTAILVLAALLCGVAHARPYWANMFVVHWINYFELAQAQNSEEIESLGWALSTDAIVTTVLASILLTVACLAAVVIIINTKKQKWIIMKHFLQSSLRNDILVTTAIRRQNLYQQEGRSQQRLQRVAAHLHGRRA